MSCNRVSKNVQKSRVSWISKRVAETVSINS